MYFNSLRVTTVLEPVTEALILGEISLCCSSITAGLKTHKLKIVKLHNLELTDIGLFCPNVALI